MKLKLICDWSDSGRDAELAAALANVGVPDIIDQDLCHRHFPFYYVVDSDAIYYGRDGHFHGNISSNYLDDPQASEDLGYYDEARGPVLRGRVGVGLRTDKFPGLTLWSADELEQLQIVAVTAGRGVTPAMVQSCVRKLVSDKRITVDAYVTFAGQVQRVGGDLRPSTPQQQELARLQLQFHLLRGNEKKDAMRKLGLLAKHPVQAQHPWQKSMRQAELLAPGQKWWAAASEERQRASGIEPETRR